MQIKAQEISEIIKKKITDFEKTVEVAEIKKQLESLTGKQVEVDAKVDPSLIGGARAQIGSVVYDGAISSQLGKMRERLAK